MNPDVRCKVDVPGYSLPVRTPATSSGSMYAVWISLDFQPEGAVTDPGHED